MTQQSFSSSAPIKGSWEELLLHAQQAAAHENRDAVPLYQKLIDRLSALPEATRLAAHGRLNQLLIRSAVDLTNFLSAHDRYDEALAVLEQILPVLRETEHLVWHRHAAAILLQSGDVETGLARIQTIAEQGDIADWGDLAVASINHNNLPRAEQAISKADALIAHKWSGRFDSADARRDQAIVATMKARLALAQDRVEESVAWYEHAMMLDDHYRANPQLLYIHLIDAGAFDAALGLIRTDQANALRAGFWNGLAYYRMGRQDDADRQWRKVVGAELPEQGSVDLLELVLSHYYLGDEGGVGLGIVLNALREQDSESWGLFYLAGLGWAMRDDLTTARSDMKIAQMRRKSMAEGRRLSRHWWLFCTDLLTTEEQAAVAEYFENANP